MTKQRTFQGDCPGCGRLATLGKHHCHTSELVRRGYEEGLEMLGIEQQVRAKVLNDTQMWAEDPATVAVRRFDPEYICGDCNSVDSVDPAWITAAGFSLSAVEIRQVRDACGTHENAGPLFIKTLREVRHAASYGFNIKAGLARAVGHSLALRYWKEGRAEKARKELEEAGASLAPAAAAA